MPNVRIACLQLNPSIGEVAKNLAAITEQVSSEVAAGAQIVVLPELASTGYAFRDADEARDYAEPLGGATVTTYLAASVGGVVIIGGFCELGTDGRIYNSAVLVEDGHIRTVYRKVHLWGRERTFFSEGSEMPPVVDTRWGPVGVSICYDLEFPEMARSLALRGAVVLALPTNWPRSESPEGERPMLHTLVMATARLNRVFVALCDRAGGERENTFLGGSMIAGPDGWPLAESRLENPQHVLVAEVDLELARDKRLGEANDVLLDRRPSAYSTGTSDERV